MLARGLFINFLFLCYSSSWIYFIAYDFCSGVHGSQCTCCPSNTSDKSAGMFHHFECWNIYPMKLEETQALIVFSYYNVDVACLSEVGLPSIGCWFIKVPQTKGTLFNLCILVVYTPTLNNDVQDAFYDSLQTAIDTIIMRFCDCCWKF